MFDNCAAYNRWTDEDKSAHLRWSLTGNAAQLLWDAKDDNYRQLVARLLRRFGGKDMEEKFQDELRCRRRKPDESLRELAQDIRRLMSLSYPGEKSGLAEHLARDAFLAALDDPELELKVREREPVDLESALKAAQRYEIFKSATGIHQSGRHRNARRIEEHSGSSEQDELTDRIVALEQPRPENVGTMD